MYEDKTPEAIKAEILAAIRQSQGLSAMAGGFADGVAEEIEALGALPGSVSLLQVADNGYTVQRLLYQENSIFAVYDAAEGYRVFRAEDRLHYLTEASHAAA